VSVWAHQRVKWTHRISLSLAVVGALAPCRLLCADRAMTQYSVTAWGHKDGLPSTFVYAVTQTKDGFLWLGTADGLVRFDGVQFTPWRPAMPNGQPLGQVRALCVSRHGDLLLGTGAGLLERMRNTGLQVKPLHSAVESLQESRDGSLWVATSAALWRLDEANLQPVQPPIAMPKGWLSGPFEDSDGKEWITTQEGVFRVDDRKLVRTEDQRSWLFLTQDGRLALLDASGRVRSIQSKQEDRRSGDLLPHSLVVSGVTGDSSGNLWIASRGAGVLCMAIAGSNTSDGLTSMERFTRNDGLSNDFVRSVFEDREHNLWVATENGLNRLRARNVLSLTRRDGLLSDTVTSIGAGKDGSVWLASPDGLERFRNGKHTVYLRGTDVLSLLVGRDQQVWVATTRGLMQWRDGRVSSLPWGVGFTAITALAEDAAGTLWFYDGSKGLFRGRTGHAPAAVTNGSLLHQAATAMVSGPGDDVWFGLASGNIVAYRKGQFRSYSIEDGLPGGAIHGLSLEPTGRLWAATERGLCFFADAHFVCRNTQNGLPGDRVLWAIPDQERNLWLGYNVGVTKIDGQQVHEAEKPGPATMRWKLFDDGDGIENSPDLEGNAPAALAQDGRLWLTTAQGVAVLDPRNLRMNPLPPPVHILELQADGQEISLEPPVRLRPLTHSIQFVFTGLSLSDPRKMRFDYRLDGFDREWHEGGARRYAFYTNLPPGRYAFRVRAANNDGVWNNAGATLNFRLAPAYFQTAWFRLLCIGAALLGAVLLFKARLRSAKRNMRLRYEERMEERTRIAQDLHDHLIQEMVGISMQLEVADELTPGGAGAKTVLQRALALSRSSIADGRLTLEALRSRPITGAAFMETLRRTAEAYSGKSRLPVEYFVEGDKRLLRPEIAEDLTELGQEALRNALKHSGRGAIRVHLVYGSSSVELNVSDEGDGITDAALRSGIPGHYGLAGMRERAARMSAQFVINSTPAGTTVHVSIPAGRAYQDHSEAGSGRDPRRSLWGLLRHPSREEKEK
jgi:signal transduction histidine kinase/ligand-binding sensor domain-containing protein